MWAVCWSAVVDPLLRAGLELPPLPSPAVRPPDDGAGLGGLGAWRALASAASGLFGTLWFSGGAPGEPGGPAPTCDPCTLAAGLAEDVAGVLLAVRSPVAAGRNPAVLARDLTALDILSQGRAVAAFFDLATGAPAAGRLEVLAEAAAVCRAVLTEADPVFEGRHFHVAGAVNRPGPVRPGGTPVVVEVPGVAGGGHGATASPDASASDPLVPPSVASELLELLVRSVDAVVVAGGVDAVRSWRQALDGRVPILWRGRLGDEEDWARRGPGALVRLLEAGADGVVLQVPLLDEIAGPSTVRAVGETVAAALGGQGR